MLLFCMANMRLGKETGTFDIVKTQYRKTGRILENGLTQIEKGALIDHLNGLSNSVAGNRSTSFESKDTKLISLLQTNAGQKL